MEKLKQVLDLMDEVISDTSVPRNIRKTVEEAKEKIGEKADATSLSMAIYLLDDISNDINMPAHTRTEIWTIISELESLKEQAKTK